MDGVAPAFGEADVLAMYGEDHSIPIQGYADLVDRYNAEQDAFRIAVATLDAYLTETRSRDPVERSWDGELRSSARANMLMGVVSNHVDVRAAAATAERLLWRVAEPILALHDPGPWPERYLELAARRIVEDSAHDSICACSVDPVVEQVLVRFAEASQIATGLAGGALRRWAATIPRGGWAAFNPSPFRRTDLVEIDLPAGADDPALVDATGRSVPTQELSRSQRTFDDRQIASRDVATYLVRRIHGRELYSRQVNGWMLDGPDRRDLTIQVSRVPDPPILDVDGLVAAIARAAAADPDARWRLRVQEDPRRTVLARVGAHGLGLTAIGPRRPAGDAAGRDGGRSVAVVGRRLDSGILSVIIEDDGSLTIDHAGRRLAGIGRLVDGGDVGDTYNYAPPPDDTLVTTPSSVAARTVEAGPLRGIVEIDRRYRWPAGLSADLARRSQETVEVVVTSRIELRVDEPFVRVSMSYDNRAADHRLRFHVPLPQEVDRSFAEGQFAVVERGLGSEAGHGEYPLPTRPADAFVAAGGIAILARHIVEYELVDGGRELALTLLRATGLISRDDHPWRDEPAGPVLPTPGAQLLGPRTFELAIMPYAGGHPGPEVQIAAETYRQPFLVAAGGGSVEAPLLDRAGLTLDGPGVVLSSLRRRDGWLEARIVVESAEPVAVRLSGEILDARSADLLGRPGGALPVIDGVAIVELVPWEIRTVQLRTAATGP